MSRKSRTTLTFTVTIPLPQKCSTKDAIEFLRNSIEANVEMTRSLAKNHPLAFLAVKEVIIRQTGRETVYY